MRKPPFPAFFWQVDAALSGAGVELWVLFCTDRGASGTETLAETPGETGLRVFFGQGDPGAAEGLVQAFREAYPTAPVPRAVTVARRPVENWAEAWRAFFRPLPVGGRLLVCPPWQVPASPALGGRIAVLIDPGQGFGTGGHPSTALALELLEPVLAGRPPGVRLLDVGVGSGILAIAGRLLGASAAVGLDLDGRVMGDVRRNLALNGLESGISLVQGTPACLRGTFPLVLANLNAPVLEEFQQELAGLTAPAGCLILSGILAGEAQQIQTLFQGMGLRLGATATREGWAALGFHRPA